MKKAIVEHVNLTVRYPEKVAKDLCQIFAWEVRWSGPSLDEGETIHVGEDDSYLALYTHPDITDLESRTPKIIANLNHVGIVVDDLDDIEGRVISHGFKPFSHRDYEPGRRFYFLMDDEIEIEVISYD